MERAYCITCGEPFWREYDEGWKKRCLDCWRDRRSQQERRSFGYACDSGEVYRLNNRVRELQDRISELNDNYKELWIEAQRLRRQAELGQDLQAKAKDILFLVHPDKHDGNPKAHELASWINTEVRQ